MRRFALPFIALLAAGLLSPSAGSLARATFVGPMARTQAPVVADDFNDNRMNTRLWRSFTNGTGVTVNETNQRLEIRFAADARPDGGSNVLDGHYSSTCQLPGDFDMQLDYELLEWPPNNGVFMQLGIPGAGMARTSAHGSERYHGWSGDRSDGTTTSDRRGTLRLVRSRGALRTYYGGPAGWVLAFQTAAPAGDFPVMLHASVAPGQFGHRAVAVAYDNFRLNSGRCPTTTTRATGVIARAWMSLLGRSARVTRVRRTSGLQANFRFRTLPVPGSRLRVDWGRGGRFVAGVGKERTTLVTSSIRSDRPLSPGLYRARLMVRPPGSIFTPVVTVGVRVG